MSPANPSLSEDKQITTSGGRNRNRILLVLGALVLFVVLGEIGYYTYLKYYKPQQETQQQRIQVEERPFSIPTAPSRPQTLDISSNAVQIQKVDKFSQMTANLPPGFFANSTIRTTYVGEFVELTEEPINIGGITYSLRIGFKNENGEKITFALTERELANLEVVFVGTEGTKEFSYKDIKEGDEISIRHTINLLDQSGGVDDFYIEVRRTVNI